MSMFQTRDFLDVFCQGVAISVFVAGFSYIMWRRILLPLFNPQRFRKIELRRLENLRGRTRLFDIEDEIKHIDWRVEISRSSAKFSLVLLGLFLCFICFAILSGN